MTIMGRFVLGSIGLAFMRWHYRLEAAPWARGKGADKATFVEVAGKAASRVASEEWDRA